MRVSRGVIAVHWLVDPLTIQLYWAKLNILGYSDRYILLPAN